MAMQEEYTMLLSKEFQDYLQNNYTKDTRDIALQKNLFPSIPKITVLEQLNGKKKAFHKLPTWFQQQGILYPSMLSMEQTSSEITASYKASLIATCDTIIDGSGGFGVDSFYFAKQANKVIHCEIDANLSPLVAMNFNTFGITNVTCAIGDSSTIIHQYAAPIDWIYLDPARRDSSQKKVFQFSDCTPNVIAQLPEYFAKTNKVMIKSAPILDIHLGLQQLKHVKAIHIVAVDNEVKELLWILEKNFDGDIQLHAVNIVKGVIHQQIDTINDAPEVGFSMPMQYLYEPNSALLKAGWFKKIGQFWPLKKLHQHSHLYTSANYISNFQGRIFEITAVIPYQKSNFKQFEKTAASIVVRNFPITVAELRAKHKLTESDQVYYFFTTTLSDQKLLIQAKKV